MGHTRVGSSELSEEYLNAHFYSQEFRSNESVLAACGYKRSTIESLSEKINCGATPKDVVYESSGCGLIRTSDVRPNRFFADKVLRTQRLKLTQSSATAAIAGDVLYTMSGTIGYAATIPAGCKEVFSFSNTIARARILKDRTSDSHYISAFFNSSFGYLQSRRLVSGGIQGHVMPNPFKRLLVITPHALAQRYIGEKVRQAEKLRAFGVETHMFAVSLLESLLHKCISQEEVLVMLEHEKYMASQCQEIFRQLESVIWAKKQEKPPQSRVPHGEMTERLDAGFYRPDFLSNAQEIALCGLPIEQIGNLCEKCNCGATPVDVVYEQDGQGLVRTSDVRPNRFQENTVLRTKRLNVNRNSPVAALGGDVLFTMSGTIGYAAVIPETTEIFSFSNTIARARIVPPNNPWFIAAFFNSSMGYKQSLRLTSGGIQGHVMPNPFKRLWVPVPDPRIQNFVGSKLQVTDMVNRFAECLVASAKLLVEALIERKVSENELIHAQSQLEHGEDSADRAILSRLYEGGWDAKETRPLFPDLDAYYETMRMVVCKQMEVAAK